MSKCVRNFILIAFMILAVVGILRIIGHFSWLENGGEFWGDWYSHDKSVCFSCKYDSNTGDILFSFSRNDSFDFNGAMTFDDSKIYADHVFDSGNNRLEDMEFAYKLEDNTLDLTYNGREYQLIKI